MRKSKYTEHQVVGARKQAESGVPATKSMLQASLSPFTPGRGAGGALR